MPSSASRAALRPLEAERLGDDADRQRARLLRHFGDDRRRAGARAAAHAGRDEHHLRAAHGLEQLIAALLGGAQAARRVAADAEPLRQLVADADLQLRRRELQRLRVGVDGDELHARDLFGDHPVDGVAAASAHAYDLDRRQSV